jgi:hypothetical protein
MNPISPDQASAAQNQLRLLSLAIIFALADVLLVVSFIQPIHAAENSKPVAPQISAAPKSEKPPQGETLHFNVNWPSGLSLGEAHLSSAPSEDKWTFNFKIDAALPGFALGEEMTSTASRSYCSETLEKRGIRGKKKVDERTEFDQKAMKATRTTSGGGKSDMSLGSCAKDALSFLYFVRRELAEGRLPKPQLIYYGAGYQARVDFTGTETIRIGDKAQEADKLVAVLKGPASENTIEMFFARDPGRTPLLVQVPLPMGKFSMEIVR